jgi:hypothetical protein
MSVPADPRTTSLAKAADAPIGAMPVTAITKLVNVLVIIVGPMAVPALVLAITRDAILPSLGDLAFGFVAVAFAGTARAITVKSEEWMAYSIWAGIAVVLQTAVATSVDSVKESELLRDAVAQTSVADVSERLEHLHLLAGQVLEQVPSALQWWASVLVGTILVVSTFELIRREQ